MLRRINVKRYDEEIAMTIRTGRLCLIDEHARGIPITTRNKRLKFESIATSLQLEKSRLIFVRNNTPCQLLCPKAHPPDPTPQAFRNVSKTEECNKRS